MKQRRHSTGSVQAYRMVPIYLMTLKKQRHFIIFISLSFLVAGICYPYPQIAMWVGFVLAAYSAIANDSIQTIGTFISSSADKKWWMLWLYIGSIFLMTVTISWVIYDGDVSYQRLASKGFSVAPSSFHFLQVAAPIFLLILTRMRMPVSTTFLLLSSFTTSPGAISGVFGKSLAGYGIAFGSAFLVWILLDRMMRHWFKGKAKPYWVVLQWITSGFLWALWIMQDAANIAVFLPRSLNITQFLVFSLTIFFGLGVIFYLKGDKIQRVVEEKTDVKDVRPATIIDLVYTLILVVFTWINTVPMSTTWVFIGLLGGRELAISIRKNQKLHRTWKLIRRDLFNALIGLLVSIAIAIASNELLKRELLEWLGW